MPVNQHGLQQVLMGQRLIGNWGLPTELEVLKGIKRPPGQGLPITGVGHTSDCWLSCSQVPLLSAGDIIIDGGNSEYRDSTVCVVSTC